MTLSPPITRIQQSSTSHPSVAALQAATRSFTGKSPPFPRRASSTLFFPNKALAGSSSCPAEERNVNDSNPLLVVQQGFAKEQIQKPHSRLQDNATTKSPLHSKSSMVAANLATARFQSPLKGGGSKMDGRGEEVLLGRETAEARQRMFQDHGICQEVVSSSSINNTQLRGASSTCGSSKFQAVDATSLENISSLKNLFEKNISGQNASARSTPALYSTKLIRPVASLDNSSLTAAIIATQLSPSNSAQNSRGGSPMLGSLSVPSHGSPTQRVFHKTPSPLDLPMLSLPQPYDTPKASKTDISSASFREPTSSNTSGISDRNALLAATLASQPKNPSSPQMKPPKPPLPRKAPTDPRDDPIASNSSYEDDSDALFANSGPTKHSKYHTARSSMSSKFDRLSESTAPSAHSSSTSPQLRQPPMQPPQQSTGEISSVALTAAFLSASPSQNAYPPFIHPSYESKNSFSLSRHLTGDSVRAASLAPSRVTSPAPKKPPPPPAPRRGRRKSLPPPLKPGLRKTMRKPPETPPKETSLQECKPRLVKRHPHKHSEGERRRWRHKVSEPERKRYEGLWAANKGLLLGELNKDAATVTSPSLSLRMKSHGPHNFQQQHVWSSTPSYTELWPDCVDSLVARDIWMRSRLPFDHLADIWDLVDRGEKGHLSRDEFLVGTWLIDQSLKGRKLPSRAQDQVWQSVRRLGVKIQPANNR